MYIILIHYDLVVENPNEIDATDDVDNLCHAYRYAYEISMVVIFRMGKILILTRQQTIKINEIKDLTKTCSKISPGDLF